MLEVADALVEIGPVARRFNVSTSTIRAWEETGMVPKAMRTPSGRRIWRSSDIDTAAVQLAEQSDRRINASKIAA